MGDIWCFVEQILKGLLHMAVDPVILQDVANVEDALTTFTGSNGQLPGLKAAVDSATTAYNAGVAQAATDKAALDATVTTLTADIATLEAGGVLVPPTPPTPPTPTVPGGSDVPPVVSMRRR
jgi:hypothetical protein